MLCESGVPFLPTLVIYISELSMLVTVPFRYLIPIPRIFRYYWLLVIFLFMLCSGGGWWFRFCRSSHSARTPTPSNSSRYSHSHSHPSNGITSHSLHTAPTTNLRASPRPLHYHHHSERTCPHHRHQIIGSNGVAVGHHQRARILNRPCNQQRSSMYYLQRIWKGA